MSDTLIEAVRPTFKTKEAVCEWLQQQATLWLQQVIAQQQQDANESQSDKSDLSVFNCFSGDFGGNRDAHEIADELHNSRMFYREIPAL